MIRPTALLFTILACGAAPIFGASTCESLTTLKLKNATITMAEPVAAGNFMPPGRAGGKSKQGAAFQNLPAFCRVAATLTPSSDSEIKIEV